MVVRIGMLATNPMISRISPRTIMSVSLSDGFPPSEKGYPCTPGHKPHRRYLASETPCPSLGWRAGFGLDGLVRMSAGAAPSSAVHHLRGVSPAPAARGPLS